MDAKLKIFYDREADILHIDRLRPCAQQESGELEDGVVARMNPETNEIENLEVLFFSTRLLRSNEFELPVLANFRLAG
jgi:hypothetical protein